MMLGGRRRALTRFTLSSGATSGLPAARVRSPRNPRGSAGGRPPIAPRAVLTRTPNAFAGHEVPLILEEPEEDRRNTRRLVEAGCRGGALTQRRRQRTAPTSTLPIEPLDWRRPEREPACGDGTTLGLCPTPPTLVVPDEEPAPARAG